MKRDWRWILLTAVAVLVLVSPLGQVNVDRSTLDHGTVFAQESGRLTVKHGELFSIKVFAYPKAGSHWSPAVPAPEPSVAQPVGSEFIRRVTFKDLLPEDKSLIGNIGSGGWYYFVFRAQQPGRTTVRLWESGPEETRHEFTIDVA